MSPEQRFIPSRSSWRTGLLAVIAAAVLAGCAARDPDQAATDDGFNDPYEASNREVHAFNRGLDKAVLRPVSRAYGKIANDDLQAVVGNVATNFATPGIMVNNLLQGDLGGFGRNLYRVVINTTLGFGGLFDPASDLTNVQLADADFGMTLARWGAGEGAYLELPVLGPSTERDAVGKVVDLFTNPLSYTLDRPDRNIGRAANVLDGIGARDRFGQTIDSVLYDSADSYAQTRLIYLQNRRFTLGNSVEDRYSDPYEDPYAQ